ncbi:ABC transporter permease [Clostridium sp. 'deep sea']|uniref:ABC transporter permease n=1 Tax=Clostridium sp. 'deep sea' TaxID=2779445 RepID=UPI0018963F99|nr:ABC transporter permease [Clostridium sp. 'deep sea']QOR35657.1 ABC transporter permease [Clostridium sp. 'deep sea']
MNKAAWISLFYITLRMTAPLLLTALGAIFSERSGVINIALEGIMTMGAFFALVVTYATHNPLLGVLAAILSGAVIAALHALVSIKYKANQAVSGVAINILAAGLTAFLLNIFYGHGGQSPSIDLAWQLPRWFVGLRKIPFIGPMIGGHSPITYIAFIMVPVTWFILYKTSLGLRLRAVGEHPRAADTLGVNVYKMRYFGVIMSGVLGGLAGAIFTIGEGTSFLEGMIAGRGFIALAAMIFGNWMPFRTMLACLLFGFTTSLQLVAQATGITSVSPKILASLPYFLTILALAGFVGKTVDPAASGKPYEKEGK